ncbi:hypothetical protein DSOL_4859 [Desulfosporosinus metallidurans]|uniref:Uncharacterized protein n=1 Tax=Desulfosporosinus metallidurans TaxID=1888891 RepID=A0A1Q8QHB1_9FIRM|nr:hypothetical protein DSOL_4859 [Desulfosporosinus metallidurans]
MAAVPKLSWASVGPANVSTMITAKTKTVIHWNIRGNNELLRKRLSQG